jgi:hypothetical protein
MPNVVYTETFPDILDCSAERSGASDKRDKSLTQRLREEIRLRH